MIDKVLFWNIRSVNTQNYFERLTELNRRHHYSLIALMEPFHGLDEVESYRRRLGIHNSMVNISEKIWIFGTDDWLELWDSIAQDTLNIQGPWIVGGDFNVILKSDEKLGGLPVHLAETDDFAHFVNNCGLMELKYFGSRYTWWNGRTEEDCIFKRLDRVFGNQEFMDLFLSSEVSHLIRHRSDHAPLHVVCCSKDVVVKPFKFLNFWSQHPKFLELVQDNWSLDFTANPFSEFQAKMKKVKMALAKWSKDTYGNIFQQISTIEDTIKVKELQSELNPSMLNRTYLHKAQDELHSYLHLEEEYWKQKYGMRWFKDGDRNTKFFHSYVKGRRKKLALQRIQNSQGDWISSNNDIREEAVRFYQNQLRQLATRTDYEMLKKIPALIFTEQNESLIALPSNEDVKLAVYGLNGDSTSGPDGFSGHFFQYFGIISNTQTSFVKGKSIVEYVLLAQDIIRDINKRNKLHNVVVKLDMAKAYDRVSWIFLTKVLRQFGFSEVIVDMVWRLVFSATDPVSLKKMMNILRNYEKTSVQLVNNDKISFYVHEKVPAVVVSRIKRKTGMRKGSFPFTYLGCPVFYGRRKIVHYESLIRKVMNRVMSWQNRLLSFGRRYILMAHVLQTMPVYLLSVMNPLRGVIDQLYKIFAKFFWSNTAGVKGKHWVAWDKMCLPKCEGGLGFRSLHDISKAFFAKLWWNFRTTITLWGAFMGNKYCKKLHPVMAQAKEHRMCGRNCFWFDNWTKQCALYFVDNEQVIDEEIEVKEFISVGEWNLPKLQEFLAEETVEYI
ncbi:uncharacterized protein LOC132637499 [Lycium barbarum]|uniref:uncharacterized protein LOC132637499 n=1 Tax=Lycium barbarum TaxID=112863 RepID=UPI00293E438A|nr:uncharacterized protein LOC132637499 [Lycium barbarum]